MLGSRRPKKQKEEGAGKDRLGIYEQILILCKTALNEKALSAEDVDLVKGR